MATNLDRSYIGPYLRDWLDYIRQSNDAEQQVIREGSSFRVPYSGVQFEMVQAMFAMSERSTVEPHAKYLAVHLLDRYMGCLFWELIASAEMLTDGAVQQVREKIAAQIKLVLASCLQIASKADLYKTGLDTAQMQDLLKWLDPSRDYTKHNVCSSELRILRTLDFRLPVCLPVDAIELFLVYADLTSTSSIRATCLHLLDVAYLRHSDLFEQLHLLARGRPYDKGLKHCRDFVGLEANAAFIGAAVVVCSNFFVCLKRKKVESLAAKLAGLIEMSAIDVNIMANILLTYAMDEEDFKSVQGRLERSDDEVD